MAGEEDGSDDIMRVLQEVEWQVGTPPTVTPTLPGEPIEAGLARGVPELPSGIDEVWDEIMVDHVHGHAGVAHGVAGAGRVWNQQFVITTFYFNS